MAGTPASIVALLAELDAVLATGQGAGAITAVRLRQAVDDLIATMQERTSFQRVTDPEFGAADPTGSIDSTTAFQAAFNASVAKPVFIPPGTYKITAPLTVPDRGVVVGEEINVWDFFNRAFVNNTILFKSGAGWSSGQAMVSLGNYSYCRGFTVQGTYNGTGGTDGGVDGFQIIDKLYAMLVYCYAIECRHGFNGAPAVSNTQGMEFHHCRASKNAGYGFFAEGATSWSDNKIMHCSTGFNATGEVIWSNGFDVQFIGNRIEDSGGIGLQVLNGGGSIISGNLFDRNVGTTLWLDNHNNATVTANQFNNNATGTETVRLTGNCTNVHLSANMYWQGSAPYHYGVDAGATFSGGIYERPPPGTSGALFADANAIATLTPWVAPPIPNLFPGYPTFPASFWAATRATLATGIAGDPLGGSQAVRLTEDTTATNSHFLGNVSATPIAPNGVITIEAFIKVGSSGTRNFLIDITDGSFTNGFFAGFNPSTGAVVTSGGTGTGTLIAASSVSAGNGWFRVWAQGTIGSNAATAELFLELASGTVTNYTGDGASNLLFYGPYMLNGSLVP